MTGNFEAKLHGFRRTQDGVVVSYVVHPNDVTADLATAALGTRYMIGFAEIGDDGTPTELARTDAPGQRSPITLAKPNADRAEPQKERRPFNTIPLSQQAALRCNDRSFIQFLTETYTDLPDDFDPADAVRDICGVASRSMLNGDAGKEWLALEGKYQAWLTDRQYAGVRR
jgi:hypothetical protein